MESLELMRLNVNFQPSENYLGTTIDAAILLGIPVPNNIIRDNGEIDPLILRRLSKLVCEVFYAREYIVAAYIDVWIVKKILIEQFAHPPTGKAFQHISRG